jgi:predicted kinase
MPAPSRQTDAGVFKPAMACALSRHDRGMERLTLRGKLFVITGLPGSGKTTRAKELAEEHAALRLTPDDWMIPLFDHNDADGKRDVLEGRFIWLAMRALEHGMSVVLDFGVWARDERSALKHLASKIGAECELVYTPIDPRRTDAKSRGPVRDRSRNDIRHNRRRPC